MKRLSLVLALLALLASAHATAETASVPGLSVQTLDGKTFNLTDHRGKWVIVNFWATWCAPCIKEMPELSEFVTTHKNSAAIGLAYEDTERADIVAFVKEHPVDYPIAQLDVENPPADFETPRGLPTTYLIAPDGTVAKRFTGPITIDDLKKAIATPSKP